MNGIPVINDPCYAHRILGSPAGANIASHWSLQRNVVSPLKEVSFGRRITHFRRDFVRSGGD